MRRWLPLLLMVLVYLAAWLWGENVGYLGTANWVGHNLVFFAVVSLIVVWRTGWRGLAWSLGGLLAGVVLGDVVGDPVYQSQLDELARQRLDPTYRQDWEPHHFGWAIASLVFLATSAVGLWRSRARRPTEVTGPVQKRTVSPDAAEA